MRRTHASHFGPLADDLRRTSFTSENCIAIDFSHISSRLQTMPRIRPSEKGFNVVSHASRQPFVCRTCRAQYIRQLHLSPRVLAEEKPFLQRMKDSLFGSKESKEKDAKLKEAQAKARKQAAAVDPTKMYVKRRKGVKYQFAPVIDPKGNYEGYTPATTWDKLEHIGGTEYTKKYNDQGEVYQG
jgi:hypothetical protein